MRRLNTVIEDSERMVGYYRLKKDGKSDGIRCRAERADAFREERKHQRRMRWNMMLRAAVCSLPSAARRSEVYS
jgi:hypothetical protein